MRAGPRVSELGASEGNEGDGSSLESSGTSDLDIVVSSLGALTPFGSKREFGISFAFSFVPGLEDNTARSITGHERGEGMYINSILSSIKLFLVTSLISFGLLDCIGFIDGICALAYITTELIFNVFLQIVFAVSSSFDNL